MPRTFIALELPQALKEGILTLARQMAKRGVSASWARPDGMHLTLKFLGDVDEPLVADVTGAVREAAGRAGPFAFDTAGLGAFPTSRRPRVLWVGVAPAVELFALHEDIDKRLAALGFPLERERFRPHITLGRLRDPNTASTASRLLDELQAPVVTVQVEEVLVMKSTLTPEGALHERLAALPLTGTGVPPAA